MLIKRKFTKITTAIATSAILLSTVAPAFAATGVGLVGNGAESNNAVNVTNNNSSTAVQTNSADISNTVSSTSNSGGNTADFNTGGGSSIVTGPATNQVGISNTANSNKLDTGNPCGCSDPTQVSVNGNGAFSQNAANVTNNNDSSAYQTNTADFTNNVTNDANTGDNSGSYNTGGGTSIFTGPAKNATGIDNKANQNVMTGGNAGDGNGNGATSLIIGNNGALSANAINATNNNSSTAVQTNDAVFSNYVDNTANSGNNTADFNTGGGVKVETGGAFNWTGISNEANSNVISNMNDCGCATGDLLKEVGNGAFSANAINATNNNDQSQYQTNAANYTNAVTNDSNSGGNSTSYGTEGFYGFDPSVITGPTGSQTQLDSSANQNVLTGSHSDGSFGGWNVNLGWDPASVMGMFGM